LGFCYSSAIMNIPSLIRSLRYYGWVILGISFLGFMVMNLSQHTIPIFMKSILEEFGASRAKAFFGISIAAAVAGIAGPAVGFLVDRFGSRRVMSIGGVLVGLALCSVSLIDSLWQFYLTFGVLVSFFGSMIGMVVVVPVLSNWFKRYRGTAITLAFVGFGASRLFSGPIEDVMGAWGWRGAFVFLGLICFLLSTPLAAFFYVERPEDRGSVPDGFSFGGGRREEKKGGAKDVEQPSQVVAETLPQAVRTPQFWALTIAQFITPLGAQVAFFHFGAHLEDVGYGAGQVAHVWGNLMLMSAISTPILGWVSDFLSRRAALGPGRNRGVLRILMWSPQVPRLIVLTWAYIFTSLGIYILSTINDAHSPYLLWLFIIVFGGSYTIRGPMYFAITADLFEGPQQARILGVTQVGLFLGLGVAPWFGGWMFDRLGSYHQAFYTGIACLWVACLCAWVMGVRTRAQKEAAALQVHSP